MFQLKTERREGQRRRPAPTTGTAVTDSPSIFHDDRIGILGERDHHYFLRIYFRTYQGEIGYDFMAAETPTGLLLTIQGEGAFPGWSRAQTAEDVLRRCWELAVGASALRHPGDVHRRVCAKYEDALPEAGGA